jgi:carboxypeptidase T
VTHLKLNRTLIAAMFFVFVLSPGFMVSTAESGSIVRIPYKGPAQVASLYERGFDVLSFSPEGYLDIAADPKQLADLFGLGVPISVILTEQMAQAGPALDANLGLYHTYAEMETALQALQTSYSGLASLEVIGITIEARNIYALKVSDNVSADEDEPEVLIMGNHHAREIMSVEIPLRFAQYLLENYGLVPEITHYIDNREIFFIPMVNPDGHIYVQLNHEEHWSDWWRKNRRNNGDGSFGVDLNRNYGYQWGYNNVGSSPLTYSLDYRGPAPFSEPETQAIRDFCATRNFVIGFSYHSYGELLLYPWGYYSGYTPDHALFYALGDTMTASNGYYQGNTAMGAIYPTNGDSDDWAYGETTGKNSFLNFTPEVNSYAEEGFGPSDTMIVPTFNKLLEMNLLLLEFADTPERVLGPYPPAMYPIDDPFHPIYTLSWSGSDPADPNPAATFELVEYKNMTSLPEDDAESLSPLWVFDGFQIGSRAYEGTGSYYSGQAHLLNNSIETSVFYTVTEETDTFSYWAWYDIEPDYDYAYCEISTDNGFLWQPIEGNITTQYNPYGSNRGHGITGASGGWVEAVFPLDAWLGTDILLRLSYLTDGAVVYEGFYADLLGPVPTFEKKTNLGSSLADSFKTMVPSETGHFTYRVRAYDTDGQLSLWSNTASIQIDDITGEDAPNLHRSALSPNYPNPFNPSTRIPFTVGGATGGTPVPVSLKIYSITGQLVAALIDRSYPPGPHSVRWSGQSQAGQPVASGIYIARLTVGQNDRFSRKLVLLK